MLFNLMFCLLLLFSCRSFVDWKIKVNYNMWPFYSMNKYTVYTSNIQQHFLFSRKTKIKTLDAICCYHRGTIFLFFRYFFYFTPTHLLCWLSRSIGLITSEQKRRNQKEKSTMISYLYFVICYKDFFGRKRKNWK